MKTFNSLFILPIIILILGIGYACKPEEQNTEELITTLKLNFTNAGNTTTFQFKDVDGIGGGADGIIDTIQLDSNKTYALNIEVLNESASPVEDLTAEILNESVDHQFFYNISSGLNLTHSYNDIDPNTRPIGLANNISTGTKSTGTLRVNLKHQPGIKDGNQNTGESDIDVTFFVNIK